MNYFTTRKSSAKDKYFKKVICELDVEPVVHEFVYKNEMMGNSVARQLMNQGSLLVIHYDEFVNKSMCTYYNNLFRDLYKFVNGKELIWKGRSPFDARTYQESGANLGEIHSVILALYTGYDLFLSNDNGAKKLADVKINNKQYKLNVNNIIDVFEIIALKKAKDITRKEFLDLTKGDRSREKSIKHIKEIWIE